MNHEVKGFTLIETLIYLALFGIIIGGVLASVYALLAAGNRTQSKSDLQEEGDFLTAKINWALTGASSFTVNYSPPTLTVNKYNYPSNPLVFSADGTKLQLKEGAAEALDLNSDAVILKNLIFQSLLTGNELGVEADMTLQSLPVDGSTISQTFETDNFLPR